MTPCLPKTVFKTQCPPLFACCCVCSASGEYEGLNAMSQPETDIQLFAGDTGMVGRTYAVRSYGVSGPRINTCCLQAH